MDEKWKRVLSMMFFALLLGLPGCGMALGDLGKGRTIMDWIFLGAIYFLFTGLMLGLIDVNYWYLAFLTAWGPLAAGILILLLPIGQQPFKPASVFMPIIFSMLGGYLGSTARAKIGAK
jgi:hypothetical protein